MFQFFKKVKQALVKTRSSLGAKIASLFSKPWDAKTLDELEQILYEADLGTPCVTAFIDHLKRVGPVANLEALLQNIKEESLAILSAPPVRQGVEPASGSPLVLLVIGINGSGKTTSIAKLALKFKEEGKKVLLGACDTFRAGAIDQLAHWAEKIGVEIVKSAPGSDPSAVAFDTLSAAKARNVDVVLLDTAGRLQNKVDLMQELEKTKRICHRIIPGSPHETFLVLDATTGQNALDQAKIFDKYVPLTGLILTKLDGSAKGGALLAIYKELKIPIRWIGVGEGAEDLVPFEAKSYVEALLET